MRTEMRILEAEGIATAVEWARREGWNPGLRDAEAFAAADKRGFQGLYAEGRLAATISLVSYGPDFAFLGFYICEPSFRGQGLGLQLWNHALAGCGARTIGLDGVTAQQANYRKSGFVLAHENIRFGGPKLAGYSQRDPALAALSPADAAEISRFELRHGLFPVAREAFLGAWLAHPALVLRRNGEVEGYGVIRPCHEGWKIGPLFATRIADAETLLRGLLTFMPEGMMFLDVPGTHAAARELATSLKLQPMFETARMYRGPAPALATEKIFGITSFELG